MISITKTRHINIGWIDHSYVAFITAVTLARHKTISRKTRAIPFVIEQNKLGNTIPNNSKDVYYAIGSFSDSDIETIITKRCRVSIIGKLYGKRFGTIKRPTKIGTVKIYPVSKERQQGLEYLSVLTNYFSVNSEISFFLKLMDVRSEMLVLLTVTDSWFDAFRLLTSSEIVSTPDDVSKVIDYIKKIKNYNQRLSEFTSIVKNSVVAEGENFVVLDFRNTSMSSKKAEIISKYLLQNRKTLFLIMESDPEGFIVNMLFRRNPVSKRMNTLQKLNTSITLIQDKGSMKVLKCRAESWNDMLEKIETVARLLAH
ncbi:MAG: hypothetical protein QXH21_08215 [Ignisphaera sp.]